MGNAYINGPETRERRDFLLISTAVVGSVGSALALWPLIDSMNPAADIAALAETEVFLEPIEPGQRLTVVWRGKPVFIARRTEQEVEQSVADDGAVMPDPQSDGERVQQAEWLVVIGICTHLGCIPLGQKTGDPVGKFGGWFCPCHGSHYDTSGRIRLGPAPKNLAVPPYRFESPDVVVIG